MNENVILKSDDITRIVADLSGAIVRDVPDLDHFAIVGLQTRGVEIARRIRLELEKRTGRSIKSGILDVTFYRDDLATRGVLPSIKETIIEFDITGITILLVDDVIFTGRTTKAALETLMGFGRPRVIRLFALVDRGNRELPIQPDYCGLKLDTAVKDKVKVRLREVDNMDDQVIMIKAV